MDTLYPCCAGLDIHKEVVVACVRKALGGGLPQRRTTIKPLRAVRS